MLLGGKFARPLASWDFIHRDQLSFRLKSPHTLIQAPAGCLLTESLAAILEADGRQLVWLRLGWEDFDPATCLLSLIEAFQAVIDNVGSAILEKMRSLPGPLQGWPGLYARLGHEIKLRQPARHTLVLENMHCLAGSPQTLALLGKHFLPALPEQTRVVLTSHKSLLPYSLQIQPEIVTARDLRLTTDAARRLFQSAEFIPGKDFRPALRLAEGSPVGLIGLYMVGQLLGEAYLQELLHRQTTRSGACAQLARDWLDTLDEGDVQSIGTLISLGYNHPVINQSQIGRPALTPSPCVQQLAGGWVRPRHLWLTSLQAALHANPAFRQQSIHVAADYLCRKGSLIPGIGLFLTLNAPDRAADYLAQGVETMLGLGQWELLKAWLRLLPEPILASQPRLLHASAEIKSAQGDLAGAADDFKRAGERYVQERDQASHVTSLLSLSTLADRQGNPSEAWSNAYRALQLAQSARLPRQESSAELQIGLLALQAGDIAGALPHLELAGKLAHIAGEAGLLKRIHDLQALAQEQERRLLQRQQQHQRYQAAQQAERDGLARLQEAIQAPRDLEEPAWDPQGWLQAPLMLKPGAILSTNGHLTNGKPGLRGKISAWLRRSLANGHRQNAEPGATAGTDSLENEPLALPEPALQPPASATGASAVEIQSAPDSAAQIGQPSPGLLPAASASPPHSPKMELPGLSAYMLGEFRLLIAEALVEQLPSGRSGVLLKYLIHNYGRRIPRDELMDIFWPEVVPESARNRLNVTLNKIRTSLRQVSTLEIILFEADKYFLNPELPVWIDVKQFEHLLAEARRLEDSGQTDQAMQSLEVAANLYQGDFLASDLYEEWTVLVREHLRLAYLDAIYRLSQRHYESRHYAACAALCQSILRRDNCREDVHCLLMRCYAHQAQIPLALRQYQICVQALRQELDVAPAATTVALYEQLRRRELTEPRPAN